MRRARIGSARRRALLDLERAASPLNRPAMVAPPVPARPCPRAGLNRTIGGGGRSLAARAPPYLRMRIVLILALAALALLRGTMPGKNQVDAAAGRCSPDDAPSSPSGGDSVRLHAARAISARSASRSSTMRLRGRPRDGGQEPGLEAEERSGAQTIFRRCCGMHRRNRASTSAADRRPASKALIC